MADDIFDKKKIISALRAQGIPDKDIEKLYGPIPKPVVNSAKAAAHQAANSWKYDNKHKRPVRPEDNDPDYEPIEELQKKSTTKKPSKPRISKKKPKPKPKPVKNDWNASSEARLKALYEAGYTTEEIATEFKTTKDAITGKLGRMRKAGWKGAIGTTHAPLPKPSVSPQEAAKLSPGMKRFLASTLETNFGAVGRFFSKKWGLIDDKKFGGSGGGKNSDVTGAVIKSNELVMNALTKLDTSLKRSTNMLTKSIATSTSKMTDAIATAIELIKKNGAGGGPTGGVGGGGSSTSGGGAAAAGLIAALAGGGALSSLFNSRAEASVNPNDMVDSEVPDGITPKTSEEKLRALGAPDPESKMPSEIEIKVKELSFEADDITFEADEFKFTNKNGAASSGGGAGGPGGAGGGGAGAGADGKGADGKETDASGGATGGATSAKPNAGMFNSLLDKLGIGGGGAGGLNGLLGKLGAGGGGSGSLNSLADTLTGSGGGKGGGKGPIPSDAEMEAKDKAWWNGGSKKNGASGSSEGTSGGNTPGPVPGDGNSFLKAQRAGFADELKNNPDTHRLLAGIVSAENPGAGPAVAESLMNRTAFINEKRAKQGLEPLTLSDMIKGHPSIGGGKSFYGPMRTGAINSHLQKLNDPKYAAKMYDNINKALGGSNTTQGHTDQGSAGDPNYLKGGTGVNINGERFNDWGVPGSAAFRERQQSQARDAETAEKQAGTKIDPEMVRKGGPVVGDEVNVDDGLNTKTKIDIDKASNYESRGPNKELMEKMQKEYNTSGRQLLEQQKESDSDKTNSDASDNASTNRSGSDKRSDLDSGGSDQTALLETEGPNHFSDYPMSDQGVGA